MTRPPLSQALRSASVPLVIDDEGLARGVTTANWIDPPYLEADVGHRQRQHISSLYSERKENDR